MDFIYDDYAEESVDFYSDAIESIAYNRDEALLFVEFQSGGEYIYSDVAESTYNMFKDAPSLGTFYRQFISGKYTSERVYDANLTKRHFEPVREDEPNEDFGLSAPPSGLVASRVRVGSRFAVKYQIAGTGIIAESEIEANSAGEAMAEFYELFASELPGQSPVVIALTQYF